VTYPPPPPPPPPYGGQPYAGASYPAPPHPAGYGYGYTLPAGPAPGLQYAGFWLRFVAYLIDTVILDVPLGVAYGIVAASVIPSLHCTVVYTPDGRAVQSLQCANLGALGALTIPGLLFLVVPLVYFVVLWGWQGQTLGQKALGLRIVDAATGGRISYARALLRWVGVFIASIPFGLGLMWAGWDPRKQGWHDKIAGTFVVRQI
jgi:uncharacterized RDD family membrane protein YckC